MARLIANNFSTTLNGAITAIATSMTLTSVTGFPAVGSGDTCQVTLDDGAGNVEIVQATAIAGSVITIVRAQEGTTGFAFADLDPVEIRLTVESLTDVLGADLTPALIGPLDMSDSAAYLSFGGSSSTTAYNLVNVGGVPALKGAANYWYTFTTDSLVMQAGTSFNQVVLKNDSTRFHINTNNSERMSVNDSGTQLGGSGARVTTILDEDAMGSDSATALATQQSIKAYVDAAAGGSPEGTAVLSTGEVGGTKFLREDGDGTCSWQAPAGGGDMVLADIQTVTGAKTFNSGKMIYAGSTSGTTTLNATAAAGTTTLTLPAATDTLVGKATTDTLTNKTLTSPTLTTPALGTPASGVMTNVTGTAAGLTAGNVTTNANLTGDVTSSGSNATTIAAGAVDVAMLANGTDGELITWDAAGAPAVVAVGTATHVLTSNGAGAAPTFQAAGGGTDTAFRAYLGSDQSISTSTFTKLQLGSEDFDANSDYDNTTNYRHTPTEAGTYQYTASLWIDVDTDQTDVQMDIRKNGAANASTAVAMPSSTASFFVPVTALIVMNGTTDYVEFWCWHNQGGTKSAKTGNTVTSLAGVKVS